MSENEDKVEVISKIVGLILLVMLIVTFSTILLTCHILNYLNENALAIIVIGFNLTLFQILWFTLRLFEARHNPICKEETEILKKQDQDTNRNDDSNGKMEVHIAVNQNKGDA